jgi:hypothetical protein
MVEHRAVTTGEIRTVRGLVEAGVPSRIIAPLIGRSFHGANYIRDRICRTKPPKMRRPLNFHISDHAYNVLDSSARRYSLQIGVIARSCLELLCRDRHEAAHAIVAPPPVAVTPGELRGIVGLQPSLQARM